MSEQIEFDVAALPSLAQDRERRLCVLVDVIRASSTIVTLLDGQCPEVILAQNGANAWIRDPDERMRGWLCAEDDRGRRAPVADFSPSLSEIVKWNIGGRRVYLETTNGTKAIRALIDRGVKIVLIGCLLNAAAVMRQSVSLAATYKRDLLVVCAGRDGARTFALDDMYCAGHLIAEAQRYAAHVGLKVTLRDCAKAALVVHSGYESSRSAFEQTASAEVLCRAQCEADIGLCARENVSSAVPRVEALPGGALKLTTVL